MSETAQDKVNRILRDHEGYTGDGKGGDGALPVGDRSTAVKPIVKRDLREALIAPLQDTWDARDVALQAQSDAEDARDLAQQAAGSVQYPVSYGVAQSLTGPQQQQARDNIGLGTAATKNHGTGAGQVPLNSDLGDLATMNVADLPQPYYEVITASTTWTKPPGFADDAVVEILAWGGGGASHGRVMTGSAAGHRSGGGGGCASWRGRLADLPATLAITIGAGGLGISGGPGGNGGTTTVGSILRAHGGTGGSDSGPGEGGSPFYDGKGRSSGDYPNTAYSGAPGQNVSISSAIEGIAAIFGGGGGGVGGTSSPGAGGVSYMGGNGGEGAQIPSTNNTAVVGGDGHAPGGGAGGSAHRGTVTFSGANGARGEVRIWIVR